MSEVGWVVEEPRRYTTRDGRPYDAAPGALIVPEVRGDRCPAPDTDWLSLRTQTLAGPSPNSPVLIFLAGGPGESAIQWPRHGPFLNAFQKLQSVAEVVLVDQRGCGQSLGRLGVAGESPLPSDALASETALMAAYEGDARVRSARLREAGVPVTAYTPEDSADDIADLARVLGDRPVALLGYSYGSHLAMSAIRRHPDAFARAVFCGFEGPDQTLKYPAQIDAQMRRIAARVADQGGPADLIALMRRVHRRLHETPLLLSAGAGEGSTALGEAGLRHIVAGWCSLSNRMGRIARLYSDLDAGGSQAAAEAVALFQKSWPKPPAFFLNDSASGVSRERLAEIERETRSDHRTVGPVLGNAVNWPFPDVRDLWGQRDLGSRFRAPLATDLPILVFTGGLDGFTPSSNVAEALAHLPNAVHREIANAAHNDLLLCPTAVEAMARFVAGGSVDVGVEHAVPVPTLV
ncbi:MAG: alpha/beta fold hydrolase [Fimbriimonadaceae bacterium]